MQHNSSQNTMTLTWGYHDKCGDNMSTMGVFSAIGIILSTMEDTSSTMGYVQYCGGYHNACGGYHKHCGVILSTMGNIMMHVGDNMNALGCSVSWELP